MSNWRSMSGYGEAVEERAGWRIEVQARSVNLKGLDVRVRTQPRDLSWEHTVARRFQEKFGRGKLEVQVQVGRPSAGADGVDWAALDRWRGRQRRIALRLKRGESPPAWLTGGDESERPTLAEADLLAVVDQAAEALDASRRAEGAALRAVVAGQLEAIAGLAATLRDLRNREREQRVTDVRERLTKFREFGLDPADERRLQEEVGLLLMRGDATEELDRLDMHLAAARLLLDDDGPVGRKLDVLAQEFGREAHTASAKSLLPEGRQAAVELRSVVEQMREQVQNIE